MSAKKQIWKQQNINYSVYCLLDSQSLWKGMTEEKKSLPQPS